MAGGIGGRDQWGLVPGAANFGHPVVAEAVQPGQGRVRRGLMGRAGGKVEQGMGSALGKGMDQLQRISG